ncbi:hypothetical protein AVEN_274786-1 [Araneus ventricosus]|uniref:Uncharacterized protein n=1 Tax=Araneus ventricosus TaxID=182803 RepID=A0A4Y2AUD9_ARAVE|nr:hypothetical protein AVEN_195151-1 [Araneus ventricosus]GBL82795.1 hypothetical protein AVEN_46803-1 [Araneus ventricosus]GBL87244.1 hypothetical protein AVEN_237549-1 [Araneus ventricosus]GBL87254.1 hypothetical protein AVEN_274786-1 [Araneus ventricosus]
MIAVTARILRMAITDHGPVPPEGGVHRHRWRISQPPPLSYAQENQAPSHLSGGSSSTVTIVWISTPQFEFKAHVRTSVRIFKMFGFTPVDTVREKFVTMKI